MTTKNKEMTHAEWIFPLLGAVIFLGMVVRFFPGLQAGFLLNDGGMFLSAGIKKDAKIYVLS